MISYQPIFAYVKIQTIMTHLRIFLLKPLSVQELLFIYFYFGGGLHWVFAAARGSSLVAASGGYSSMRRAGFSLLWPAIPVAEHGLQAHRPQQLRLVGSRAQAQ